MGARVADEHWQAGGAFGDVVAELVKEGHIPQSLAAAAHRLLMDFRGAYGSSEGIVSQVTERVQSSVRMRDRPPGYPANSCQERMSYVLRHLRAHERETLHWLVMKRELPRGSLADLGRVTSAYKTQKTARAAATGQVRALLATICELHEQAQVAA